MAEEERSGKPLNEEEFFEPGHLIIALDDSFGGPVAYLGGKIVVDSRPQNKPSLPKNWIDREQSEKYSELVGAVRYALVTNQSKEQALLKAGKDLGLEVTRATFLGKIPTHWISSDNDICRRWKSSWESKHDLLPKS